MAGAHECGHYRFRVMTRPLALASVAALAIGALTAPAAARQTANGSPQSQDDIDALVDDMLQAHTPARYSNGVGEELASIEPVALEDAATEERKATEVNFEADEVAYDSEGDRIFARGNVILRSERASVRADEVEWDRATATITARGNVRFVDRSGNQVFTETVQLNDAFEAGAMDDLLLALRTGGRLANELRQV